MYRRMWILLLLPVSYAALDAQEFKIFDRPVQVHGFISQGIAYTDHNNWLTMKSSVGSYSFTDFRANISMPVRISFVLARN